MYMIWEVDVEVPQKIHHIYIRGGKMIWEFDHFTFDCTHNSFWYSPFQGAWPAQILLKSNGWSEHQHFFDIDINIYNEI